MLGFFLPLTSVIFITFSLKIYSNTACFTEVCSLSRYKEQTINLRDGIWGVLGGLSSILVNDPPETLQQKISSDSKWKVLFICQGCTYALLAL